MMKLKYKVISCVLAALFAFPACAPAFTSKAETDIPADTKSVRLPILMYHEVKRSRLGKDVISPYEMESDFQYLKRSGYTAITMTDLINHVYGNKKLPEKPVILSFDDGYLSNYVYVYPLLKKYNINIVMSIIGKYTDDYTEYPDDNLNCSHATWNQLNEMIKSGHVEIQNHTYNLHTITRRRFGCQKRRGESVEAYEQVLTSDLTKLQEKIKSMTGCTPNTFAYPYGQVSKESLPVLKKLGFKASLTCDFGINVITKDPEGLYGLKRICRSHGVSAQKSIKEAMETLKYRS